MIRVEIVDTGIGIENHIIPHLFRAFEQGDASITVRFGGLGLGLAISRYAALHAPSLRFLSHVNLFFRTDPLWRCIKVGSLLPARVRTKEPPSQSIFPRYA